jgi:hypothetical protein
MKSMDAWIFQFVTLIPDSDSNITLKAPNGAVDEPE